MDETRDVYRLLNDKISGASIVIACKNFKDLLVTVLLSYCLVNCVPSYKRQLIIIMMMMMMTTTTTAAMATTTTITTIMMLNANANNNNCSTIIAIVLINSN